MSTMDLQGAIVQQNMKIEATGSVTSVPNVPIARLMYYVNCMTSCLPGLDVVDRVTNFANYSSLDEKEKGAVVLIACLLGPETVLGKVVFLVNPGNELLRGTSNEFYKMTETQALTGVIGNRRLDNAVVVQGKRVEVTKFMLCTEGWFNNNLVEPLKAEVWRLRAIMADTNSNGNGNSGGVNTTGINLEVEGQQQAYGSGQPSYPPPSYGVAAAQPVVYAPPPQPVQHTPVYYSPAPRTPNVGEGGRIARGSWNDSLFACLTDIMSCLVAWILAPYRVGRTVERAHVGAFNQGLVYYGVPWLLAIIFWCIAGSSTWAAWAGIIAYTTMTCVGGSYRKRIRDKYGIPGDNGNDWCAHFCCPLCAVAQEARHIDRDHGYA